MSLWEKIALKTTSPPPRPVEAMPHKRSSRSLPGRLPRPSWQSHPWCPARPPGDASCRLSFPRRSTFGDARISVGSPPLTSSLFQVATCALPGVMGNPSVKPGPPPQPVSRPAAYLEFLLFCLKNALSGVSSLPTFSLLLPKKTLTIRSADLLSPPLPSVLHFPPPYFATTPNPPPPSLTRCSVGTRTPQC